MSSLISVHFLMQPTLWAQETPREEPAAEYLSKLSSRHRSIWYQQIYSVCVSTSCSHTTLSGSLSFITVCVTPTAVQCQGETLRTSSEQTLVQWSLDWEHTGVLAGFRKSGFSPFFYFIEILEICQKQPFPIIANMFLDNLLHCRLTLSESCNRRLDRLWSQLCKHQPTWRRLHKHLYSSVKENTANAVSHISHAAFTGEADPFIPAVAPTTK